MPNWSNEYNLVCPLVVVARIMETCRAVTHSDQTSTEQQVTQLDQWLVALQQRMHTEEYREAIIAAAIEKLTIRSASSSRRTPPHEVQK